MDKKEDKTNRSSFPSAKNEFENLIKGNPTKSNLVQVPQITLPKGGGAIKGIDEKFIFLR